MITYCRSEGDADRQRSGNVHFKETLRAENKLAITFLSSGKSSRSLLAFEHEGHGTKTLPNKQRFYARLRPTLRLRHIHIRWPSTPLIERTPTLKCDAAPAHKMDFMDLSFCFVFFENKLFDLKWRFRATWPMKTLWKSRSNWGFLVTKTLRFLHSNLI